MKNSRGKGRGYIICVDDDRSLLDVLIQQLESGLWYFNVHDSAFPGGEIRGQILPSNAQFFRLRQ